MEYTSLEDTPVETYERLGLISGLEIHQQLLTEKKLFCRCRAGRYSRHWDAEILRHMRPTLSELGEYDGTALMEFKTKKRITYRINKETVCTYEFDDTPPFEVNETALDIALELTLLLKCNLVSELHIARKQYLDGSIPAGFQRTTILGVDGWIPFEGRRIRIRQLALEEDSCREVSDIAHERCYITDRLGMPLSEAVTEPDMKTPQEVAGVAQVLRRLARATGKVRTGAGAARQDVNVSIRGGNRCEIKGVSSIRRIPLLVHNEAFRQAGLLSIRDALRARGITPQKFRSRAEDVTPRLKKTRFGPIRHAVGKGQRVLGVRLDGYEGILRRSLGPGRSFLQEVSDRVRVIACIDWQPNVITSDLPDGTLSPDLWMSVRKALGAKEKDAVVLVWGPEADALTGAAEIAERAREAAIGVPLETRQSMPDGTTGFERILPGADRMYPDTDLPPKAVRDERIEFLSAALPEAPWEREQRYRDAGVHAELARVLSVSPFAPLFDACADDAGDRVGLLARLLVGVLPALAREGFNVKSLAAKFFKELLRLHRAGRLMRGGLLLLVKARLKDGGGEPEAMIARLNLTPASQEEIDRLFAAVLSDVKSRTFGSPDGRVRYAMGAFMYELGVRVDGAKIRRRIEDSLGMKVSA